MAFQSIPVKPGVLHFKGFIIDDSVLYSGASLNDVYLHQHDKYRYDRYHLIRNRKMSNIMFEWVTQNIMNGRGVNRLDDVKRPIKWNSERGACVRWGFAGCVSGLGVLIKRCCGLKSQTYLKFC